MAQCGKEMNLQMLKSMYNEVNLYTVQAKKKKKKMLACLVTVVSELTTSGDRRWAPSPRLTGSVASHHTGDWSRGWGGAVHARYQK